MGSTTFYIQIKTQQKTIGQNAFVICLLLSAGSINALTITVCEWLTPICTGRSQFASGIRMFAPLLMSSRAPSVLPEVQA